MANSCCLLDHVSSFMSDKTSVIAENLEYAEHVHIMLGRTSSVALFWSLY